MLVAPLFQFETKNVLPRVVSEVRKIRPATPKEALRPRISGELLVICSGEKRWWPSRVKVCSGQLQVGGEGGLRLPLRHLSLGAGPLPRSLALYRGNNLVITLQTASERAFDLWVKTIAIELIRQTPLDAVRYLDILTFAECWNRKNEESGKDYNCNELLPVEETPMKKSSDYNTVEVILKKCQNPESYVPVREKLMLFESLCKMGRKVRSTEDVSTDICVNGNKKAVSMHDLSNCLSSTRGVRQICKYFEDKASNYGTIVRTNRRLINSDSQLDNVRNVHRFHVNLSVSYA